MHTIVALYLGYPVSNAAWMHQYRVDPSIFLNKREFAIKSYTLNISIEIFYVQKLSIGGNFNQNLRAGPDSKAIISVPYRPDHGPVGANVRSN